MTVLAGYERALLADSRVADPEQRRIATRLDELERCLASTPAPGAMRHWLRSLRADFSHPATCRGLYIWGPVGRGKTWLMDLFHAELQPHGARRLHFAHFMREIHARRRGLAGHERPLDRIAGMMARNARTWCLDEFMVQDIGDAMILHGVLEGLLRRGVVLVVTSNTPPSRLYEGGLQRERFMSTIALLERSLDVLAIGTGTDYRQRQLQSAPTYLASSDPATAASMAALFQGLAGAAAVDAGTTMTIEDRQIEALRHAGGMAWFSFGALCDGPRNADDYIAIARHLHTVFLSEVPVFDGGNDDPARRFIALIDELYDRKVRLVVSAAAEPDQLYRGTRLQQMFTRTASRLMEMRSQAYLANGSQAAARTER